jgi:uncharacterized protein YegP (UPF0339 family)
MAFHHPSNPGRPARGKPFAPPVSPAAGRVGPSSFDRIWRDTMTVVRVACLAAFVAGLFGLAAEPVRAEDPKLKFEVYKDKANSFRWRLKAENGAVLATAGQGYKAVADAKKGAELVQRAGTDDKMKFEYFADAKKEHRWRLKAGNGQVVASASEGYKDKSDAEKAVADIKAGAAKAEVVEVKE